MLRVGLIGCGGMGSVHANGWLSLKDHVKLVAIADPYSEKARDFCKDSDIILYHSAQDMLTYEKPDIVDICTPTYLHTKYAVLAMKAGCHVFCEKPLCLTKEEADLLAKTQKETGVMFQVGQVIRFWNEYRYIKEVVEQNTFGKIISGTFERLSPNPKWSWENWFNDYNKSGTVALDLHIHDVDFIRYLNNGKHPKNISSTCTRDKNGVLQQILTTYQYEDAYFTAEGCWDYPDNYPFSMRFRIKFENATVVYSDNTLTVYPVIGEPYNPAVNNETVDETQSGINVSNQDAYTAELLYFTRLVQGNIKKEIAPLAEGIASVELVLEEIDSVGGMQNE